MKALSRWLIALALVGSASCGGDGGSVLEREGGRVPDDAGIATDMTLDRIQLDGDRTYEIHEAVESFTTRSHRVTSLLAWEGRYVHIGLEGERVRWIAGIGLVSGDPPVVRYSGIFESLDTQTRQATFEDGTVLVLAEGVDLPEPGREVVAEIDVGAGLVVRLLN